MKNYALLGAKLGHSLSPLIHNTIFTQRGMDALYTLLEIPEERLPLILPALHTLGFSGINITLPYKKSLLSYFDEISPEAQFIGAVNTVRLENGSSFAHNTDCKGFGLMLERAGIGIKEKSVSILGTGGAALSAAAYALGAGAKSVAFFSRKPEGVLLGCPVLPYEGLARGDIAVNATPLGMHPNIDASPLDKGRLALFETAVDLIYRPLRTKFLQDAESLGLKTAGGLDMLIGQALDAQKIWNGIDFSPNIFDHLRRLLEGQL